MVGKNNTLEFSVSDFINGYKTKNIRLFGEECLDENNEIISFSDQAAIVTHLLKAGERERKIFESKGKNIIDLWVKWYLEKEEINDVSELKDTFDAFTKYIFVDLRKAPFQPNSKPTFKFIDLFAGIGGFRLALQDCGGECVYSSEWDENAKHTYYYNFGEVPFGDITKESNKRYIPDEFDVLCAGFPCQAFSIAGYRKGFEDTRGTLFFDVAEIIKRKRPKAVFLENVKNLYTHDKGKTFKVIKSTLEELGYKVFHQVMNAMEYANVPQNRERIFIVCFDPLQVPNYLDFTFPEKITLNRSIVDFIDYGECNDKYFYTETFKHYNELVSTIRSTDTIYQWRRQYVRENKSNVCPTLTANMGTGGHNVPLILTDNGIRKLTPKECLNFQGYPSNYFFPENIADSAKYKQAGNSVVVPLITKVCKNIVTTIYPNL